MDLNYAAGFLLETFILKNLNGVLQVSNFAHELFSNNNIIMIILLLLLLLLLLLFKLFDCLCGRKWGFYCGPQVILSYEVKAAETCLPQETAAAMCVCVSA